jgi:drug/metabolite transporter (DMT)-like permease
MVTSHVLGVLLAFASALLFGSGDFSGGLAARRHNQFQVLVVAGFTSVALLAAFAFLWGESLIPSPRNSLWAALAGVSGSLGLAVLYRALSSGNAAVVSPTAGVVGAALPVIFGAFTEGLPDMVKLIGFVTAIFGIWLVTQAGSPSSPVSQQGLVSGIVAGVAFGGFFILIAQVEPGTVFAPLMVAKIASACVALLLMLPKGIQLPSPKSNPIAPLAGVLDSGANALYLLAQQLTRLDVAVVVTSLYPAATVLLARVLLKEHVSRTQWAGVGLCLVAIALIVV